MNKRAQGGVLAVLLLVGIGVGLFLMRGRDTHSLPSPPAPTAQVAKPPAPAVPAPPPSVPSRHAAPLRLVPAATSSEDMRATHGAFEGRVVSATTGEGIAGAELTFSSDRGGASSIRTGADGRFRFLPGAPGTYQLAVVTAQGYLPFGPEWGESPIRLTATEGHRISDLVLALTPEVELLGKVLSPDGQPVAGARIRLLTGRAGESVLFPTADGFTSDSAGEFRFHAPEGAQVEARHPEYTSARAEVTPSVALSRRMELTLGRRTGALEDGGTRATGTEGLAGRVVDSRSAPLPGALVSVRTAARAYPAVFGDPMGYEALTDGEGRFTVEGLEPGTYDITAHQMGLAPARLKDIAAGRKDLTLILAEGTKLVGSVRDAASGAPISSFSVSVMLKVGPLQRESFTQLSFIDAQGHYALAGLPIGSYVVQVAAPGYAPAEAPVEVPDGASSPVRADFALSRGARLTGRVVEADDSQRPIAQARVSVEGTLDTGALSVRFDALSDTKGDFAIDGLPPQEVSLYVAAEGHHSRVLSNVRARPGTVEPLVIALRKTKPGEEPQVELVGIGAVLAARDDALVLGQVVEGGGAAEAGLAVGDSILRIDGVSVVELGFAGSINRIRGPENSRVVLSIRRGQAGDAGTGPGVDVPVTRRRLQQ
ncbi:carboxypeptidase regulatory-like domain-containing protein [Hyalangium rubrum]|uniref:Carboxypeptidase regulatory-like domain-containing protein n=1 Tax=Hyalangium rubrum TaxID=3103134 RepID=A0ABU5GZU1_9BACT|nr:carboxypeptidase regulatory-like domain-containing protein [Hyalangium sp. s54d21]MDY7226712.1 carboxypeptidase regulatory-like domain-containing protein [Hyalangium sp. s54d21]